MTTPGQFGYKLQPWELDPKHPRYRERPSSASLYAASQRSLSRNEAEFNRLLDEDGVDVGAAVRRVLGLGRGRYEPADEPDTVPEET